MIHRASPSRIALAPRALENSRAIRRLESARHEAESGPRRFARAFGRSRLPKRSPARASTTAPSIFCVSSSARRLRSSEAARATADAEACARDAVASLRQAETPPPQWCPRRMPRWSPCLSRRHRRGSARRRSRATPRRRGRERVRMPVGRRRGRLQVARHRRASHRRTQRGAGAARVAVAEAEEAREAAATATGARRRRRSITSGCKPPSRAGGRRGHRRERALRRRASPSA